jgi:EKC/KEOPS complex subunit CGI121/TPRKB
MSKHLQITLPQFPGFNINVHKFTNVSNSTVIKSSLLKGDPLYDFAFINATTVISLEQLLSALYRALLDYTSGGIRTKTIHSEVIFSLSPTQNIMDALRRFGIQDDSSDLILIKILKQGEAQDYDLSIVQGEEVNPTDESFERSAVLKTIKKVSAILSTTKFTNTN